MVQFNEYWQVIQERVCVKCIDSDSKGHCRIGSERECALRTHFSKIVETVLSVESDGFEPYIHALRQNVCANCRHQSKAGICNVRKQVDCALDRYFPMVVDLIQGAQVPLDEHVEAFGD